MLDQLQRLHPETGQRQQFCWLPGLTAYANNQDRPEKKIFLKLISTM